MDIATVVGLVVGIVLILFAIIVGGSPGLFLDIPSILIVVGGTIGVTFVKNPLDRVFGTIKVVKNAFTTKASQTGTLVPTIVELSRKARRESLLALEKAKIDDAFLSKGVRLAVDGMEPSAIRSVLETEISFLAQRHKAGQELLEGVAGSAPSFGMIGTLIGLVQMLATMDDPAKIGPSMAIAILTTLYGSLIAYVFAQPLAEKLKIRSREEVNARLIVLEGVLAIVEGDHPASVEQKLTAYLEPAHRKEGQRNAA